MLWIAGLVAIYVAILAGLTFVSIRPYRIPAWISLGSLGRSCEEVEFPSLDGVRLRASWTPTPESTKVAVLCHGYMMNRSELVPEANHLCDRGYSCLLIDFRAHGKSGYAPSSVGFRERQDVVAAVRFAESRQPGSRMLLVGSSMGAAAIAFALAEDSNLAEAAVIDSAYDRMDHVITGWWHFIGGRFLATLVYPIKWVAIPIVRINPFKTDVTAALTKIGPKPLLFFHGGRDTLASPQGAERNFAAAAGPKKIVWFEGLGHSEGRWIRANQYRDALLDWLDENGL